MLVNEKIAHVKEHKQNEIINLKQRVIDFNREQKENEKEIRDKLQ